MKRSTRKILCIIGAFLIVIGVAGYFAAGNYFFEYALLRETSEEDDPRAPKNTGTEQERANIAADNVMIDAWLKTVDMNERNIKSEDGLNLWAKEYKAEQQTDKWLLAIHGYKSEADDVLSVARQFHERGYNVLTPHMRAHGKSEGDYIGMGWLDKNDVVKWIDMIVSENPNAEIVLYGKSMGGATVMMTSGEELPTNVKAIVEDCGYTSVYEMFVAQLDYRFGLPEFPIMNAARTVAKIRADYDIKEASAVEQLKKCKVPMLFIHGSEDTYVPTEMVYELYEIPQVEKDILVVEGAEHAASDHVAPELFYEKIWEFLEKIGID